MDILSGMLKEQQDCFKYPDGYEFQCAQKVMEKYTRQTPLVQNLIYPWRNFDWDYSVQVEKMYSPEKLGASSQGTIAALVKDIELLVKIIEGFILTPNPNSYSSASNPDRANDLVPCATDPKTIQRLGKIKEEIHQLENLIQSTGDAVEKGVYNSKLAELVGQTQAVLSSCAVLNKLKMEQLNQKVPYPSSFFNKPLDGESSSSYYALTGMCPSPAKDKETCQRKGYTWIPNPLHSKKNKGPNTTAGSCFKGKYLYLDNKPGIAIGEMKSLKGLIPSLVNNLGQLSPDKLAFAANGFGIPGLAIQSCQESFCNYSKVRNGGSNAIWMCQFIVILIIGILIFALLK